MSAEPILTFLDEDSLPYPFCPGCGHGAILDQLDLALAKLNLDPHKTVLVTDIGCAGLSDRFFKLNAFHGLHGRSLTYASGIKLANPELTVIVLIGDGGCGIGGNHLIHAARRNIGVTTLVFNNLNYGMTGGEHSVTTPLGAKTSTTRYGQLERPMDICATVQVNGASFVARTTSFDKNLTDLIAEAIQNDGFSLIDIWELCVAHFVPRNKFNRRLLEETMDSLGFAHGVLHREAHREFSLAYRRANAHLAGADALPAQLIKAGYTHNLNDRLQCVIAGTAGQRVRSAALAFGRGALLSGLWASQSDDYPVTVRSGHSLSHTILSPQPIQFGGLTKPDLLVVLSPDGLRQVGGDLVGLEAGDRLYINASLLPVKTAAAVFPLELKQIREKYWSLVATAAAIEHTDIYPIAAYREAISMQANYAQDNLAVLDKYSGTVLQNS